MADDLTRHSDRLIEESRALVQDNRDGGRHRRVRSRAIGRGSADIRSRNFKTRLKLIVLAAAAIFVASSVIGVVIDGLGFTGLMATLFALVGAVWLFANYPKVKIPQRGDLNRGDARQLVARTELWLESQRPALPPPAVTLIDTIGVQLDALGLQLETIDQEHPAAVETRKLVGETLPEMVDAYRRIPAHLRTEKRAGATPDQQLVDSLGTISGEIDQITRQLADGALDDLAVRTRYLDYRYGAADEPAALPAPGKEP